MTMNTMEKEAVYGGPDDAVPDDTYGFPESFVARPNVSRSPNLSYVKPPDNRSDTSDPIEPARVPDTVKRVRLDEVRLMAKWEGYVNEIYEGSFRASFGESGNHPPEIEAEFDKSELEVGCRKILKEGMPLVWAIVRERRRGGLCRSSIIYLLRKQAALESEISQEEQRLNSLFNV